MSYEQLLTPAQAATRLGVCNGRAAVRLAKRYGIEMRRRANPTRGGRPRYLFPLTAVNDYIEGMYVENGAKPRRKRTPNTDDVIQFV